MRVAAAWTQEAEYQNEPQAIIASLKTNQQNKKQIYPSSVMSSAHNL
jgi:hypothetical protein